jgi:hypothetical protein
MSQSQAKLGAESSEPALIKFWGKPLARRDLRICEALDWVVRETKEGKTIWSLAQRAKIFDDRIHIRGRPRRFQVMGPWLCDRLDDARVTALDSIFGTRGKDLEFRMLLELIEEVISGNAAHVALAGRVVFSDHLRPPWHIVDSIYGTYFVSPNGLLCARADNEVDQLGLRNVMTELETRGLMHLHREDRGIARWFPTAEGQSCGLDSTNMAVVYVLLKLGLADLVAQCDKHPVWRNPPRRNALLDKLFGPDGLRRSSGHS